MSLYNTPMTLLLCSLVTMNLVASDKDYTQHKHSIEHSIQLGESYVNAGDHESAIRVFTQLAEQNPTEPNMKYNLASAYKAAGQLVLAKKIYKEAAALNVPEALLTLGNIALEQGQKEDAIAYFQNAGDKGLAAGYYNIGHVELRDGNQKVAHFWFQRAADADPTFGVSQWDIGVCFYKNKQFYDALPYFSRAADEGQHKAWHALSLCYRALMHEDPTYSAEAIDCAETAFAYGEYDSMNVLADIYASLGNNEKAQNWNHWADITAKIHNQTIEIEDLKWGFGSDLD